MEQFPIIPIYLWYERLQAGPGENQDLRLEEGLPQTHVSRSDLLAYGVKDHKYYGQAGFGCEPDRSI
jgi:hypothetical protein